MGEFDEEKERVCFFDVWNLCKQNSKKILSFTLVFAALAGLFTLRMPIRYVTEGSFKDSGKVRPNMIDPISSLSSLASNSPSDSPSIPLIKSRAVITKVIQKMGLQASIAPEQRHWPVLSTLASDMANIRDNLKVQFALWNNSKYPSLPEVEYPLLVQDVVYYGEVPLVLSLQFEDNENYSLYEREGLVGNGKINEPFFGYGYQFTIFSNDIINVSPQQQKRYSVFVKPLSSVTQELTAALSVESDRNGKSILWMRFADRDRILAANFVNTLMETYRNHNIDDDRKIIQEQISYLHRRQDQIASQLKEVMQTHAGRCSQELTGSGFPDVETEISFFVTNHKEYHSKLFAIELERARLQKYLYEGFVYYDKYATEGDPSIINKLLSEIRNLKQQSDTIELALSRLPIRDEEQLQKSLSQQLAELEQTRQDLRSIDGLLSSVQNGFLATITVPTALLNHPRYLISLWMQRLKETQQRWLVAPPTEKMHCTEDWEHCKSSFISYLSNLKRQLEVYATNIEERMVRHQDYPTVNQGLDLKTGWDIYNLYTKKLSELEAEILQGEFIALQIQDPDFEVSSLSSALQDKVSQELFTKASKLVLELRDQSNRSDKEINRLKDELKMHKEFLAVHLHQTLQLLRLNQKTLVEKIQTHQGLLRELIQMRLTVLNKHLEEYVNSRLGNLEQEQMIIQQRQRILRDQMGSLPVKLIEKKLIDHQIEINRMMIEQVMKLVESKNISGHLEVLQSAPLDFAIAPIHPRPCKLLFFIVAGALIGFFVGIGYVLIRSFSKGMPASARSLKNVNQSVAGALPTIIPTTAVEILPPKEKNTIYNMINFLAPIDENLSCQRILTVEKAAQNCGMLLAKTLSSRKDKVLYVHLDLANSLSEEILAIEPSLEGYDKARLSVSSGSLSHASLAWLKEKEVQYNYLICSIAVEANSALALGLKKFFSKRIVAADSLPMQELQPWFTKENDSDQTVFVTEF